VRELEKLPDAIDAAETAIREGETKLNDPMMYADKGDAVAVLMASVDAQRSQLDALLARWEELERRREATAKK
jgi:hypothetical protein